MDKGLLLGEEKRELEILEFTAGGNSYGIDISDIREILPYEKNPRKIPNSHPSIEGIIMPRDFIIPIVNVVKSLNIAAVYGEKNEMLIVTSISNLNIAFHVDGVQGMHRTTTENITRPGKKLTTPVNDAVIGILNIQDRAVEILEFRNIIKAINPNTKLD